MRNRNQKGFTLIELGRDAGGLYGIGAYRPAFLATAVVGVVAVGVYGLGGRVGGGRSGVGSFR